MTRWRNTLRTLLLLALLAPPAAAQEPQLVSMGTGNIAGVYFPVGVALCRLVNQHRRETGLRCAATALRRLGRQRDRPPRRRARPRHHPVRHPGRGARPAPAPSPPPARSPRSRAVMALYPEPLTLVARADAGVARVEDLAGKRVWLGRGGLRHPRARRGADGRARLDRRLLRARRRTSRPTWSADALCDGQIDAFLYAVGHPALVIQEATTACDAALVDVAGPAVTRWSTRPRPSSRRPSPPASTAAPTAPVATFGVGATLVTRADLPEDTIYTIVSAVFGDFETLRGLDPVLAGLDPEAMARDGLTAPLHPGAARYFRERGWIE